MYVLDKDGGSVDAPGWPGGRGGSGPKRWREGCHGREGGSEALVDKYRCGSGVGGVLGVGRKDGGRSVTKGWWEWEWEGAEK